MATFSLHSNTFFFLIFLPLILNLQHHLAVAGGCQNPPVITLALVDSQLDSATPLASLTAAHFFPLSTGRLSDGRFVIDLLCQSLNTRLLNPYLDSLVGYNFQNGANFAIVGSSTLPRHVPFALNIQLMQLLHFKSRAFELDSTSDPLREMLISQSGFRNALYMID